MLGGIPELMVTAVTTTILMASFLPMQQNLQDAQLAATAAWEIAAVRDAAAQYIKDNWTTVLASVSGEPQVITVSSLQAAGYPVGTGMNPWRQNHAVLIEQSGSGILGLVVSYGGNPIPANRLLGAASLIGKYGAYVPYPTDPSPCGAPCVKGLGTYWTQPMANFASAGATAAYVPTSGHLAAGILFQGGEEAAPWLCRHFQPGNTDCAIMYTDIDMNGYSIKNAKDITATDQVIAAKLTDYVNDRYYIIPSGTSNMSVVDAKEIAVSTSVTSPVYYHSSDLRLKANIGDIKDPLLLVERLKGHRFQWKADGSDDLGLVAQEVQKVLPEAVKEGPDGYLAVKYDIMVAPLIEAVKTLAGRVDALQNEMDAGHAATE